MKVAGSMEKVALFPLRIFLLPGSYARLFIFEERYQQLIHDCESGMEGFGIAYSGADNRGNLGSWVELHKIENRYPTGEMDIVVHSTAIYRLNKFNFRMDNKLYPGGEVEFLASGSPMVAGEALQVAFRAYLLHSGTASEELLSRDDLDVYEIAGELGLSNFEKLELAGLADPASRCQYLINYLRYLEFLERQEQRVFKDIYLN